MINPSNICIFEGRMVADAKVSSIQMGQNNVDKAIFRVAVERNLTSEQRKKVKAGDTSIKTADFVPCSLLGGQVSVLQNYFPQGTPIKVVGRYTDYKTTDSQTGQDKYGYIFEVDSIGFTVSSGNSGNNNQNNNQQQNNYQNNNNRQQSNNRPPQQQAQQPSQGNFSMFDDEEMPF